jgi:predicted AAA+ superfamily ATPase
MSEYQRKALGYLRTWLEEEGRRPLVIRGARQVGKTWAVRALAELSNKHLVELNFERQSEHESLFSSNDPTVIVQHIEAEMGIDIVPERCILFLDEIQVFPELLSKLRWFAEEMPELAVIAAGSLLDFVLDDHEFSMPVGRITYLHMEPLSFEEFLGANAKHKLLQYIESFTLDADIPVAIHQQLMSLFKTYVIVGGMPAAVYRWVSTQSINAVGVIHSDLIATYRDDFSKYANKIPTRLLDMVMVSIPRLLSNKFVCSKVTKEYKAAHVKEALHLLSQARLCTAVYSVAANGLPLAAEINTKFAKVIALDVGLVSAMLGLKLNQIDVIDDINLVNKGAVSEQVVGQLLRCVNPVYQEPELYYWQREAKSANAEIDYVIQHGTNVLPVEVKSGSTGGLKSLHAFMQAKKLQRALRFNADLPSCCNVSVKLSDQTSVKYQLISLPFYLIEQLERLVN